MSSRQEQIRIVKSCHIEPTSGHLGIKKTFYRITERFTWIGIYKYVKNVVSLKCNMNCTYIYIQVSSCDECQRVKDKICTSRPELHVPVHSPWHHIGLDFVGPISPVSTQGNRYILTVSDYFSKWVCAFALPNKEATGVAVTLMKVKYYKSGANAYGSLIF